MSKYQHPSRTRQQGTRTVRINTSADSDDDEIGPPKLSNFGSALLARSESGSNHTGSNMYTRLHLNETYSESQSQNSYHTHTQTQPTEDSPQSSSLLFGTMNNRPQSMTTINDTKRVGRMSRDNTTGRYSGDFSGHSRDQFEYMKNNYVNEKVKGLQQSMKEEVTSRYTERRINRLLSSNRMSKLGPAKRTSSVTEVDLSTKELEEPIEDVIIDESPIMDYSSIEFGQLNPLQYLKQHKLPSTELPHISKVYFEKRKEEIRRTAMRKYSSSKEILLNSERFTKKKDVVIMDKENVNPSNGVVPKKREALSNISVNKKEPELKKVKKVEIKEPKRTVTTTNSSIEVNGVEYERLEMLGRGGSSKVYKVKSSSNKIYALKRVLFDEFDETSVSGFKGEIQLLEKLRHEERVVHLYDYSMDQGLLYLIMECGDFDLSQILNSRSNMAMDIEFIRYYTREMVRCIQVVHEAGIVHSDLKPANFVMVKGILKIIDFGIANAVPDHTVNIYRESQIGTPNYMAPEALVTMNNYHSTQENTWKVGKPSDIWSCGCIIYQMVYGKPPYAIYQGQNRLLAIMNPEVKITFNNKTSRDETIPRSLIEIMKICLIREPETRPTIETLLHSNFLNPVIVSEFFIRDLIKNAVTFGVSQGNVTPAKLETLTNDVLSRLEEFKM